MKASEANAVDYPHLTWLGTVIGAHGIQGEVKVYPLTDEPEFYCKSLREVLRESRDGLQTLTVQGLKLHKGVWILRCAECVDRNEAETWKKSRLLIEDQYLRPLREDEVFLHQLSGATVVDEEDHSLGTVKEILETGAGHVYVVRQPQGGEFLVPARGNIVLRFEPSTGKLVIDPIPGLLDS